tara:strand:+ start:42965 stop:44308 length:1344 start_codon:yes stop_codon:yes gene_type:complete
MFDFFKRKKKNPQITESSAEADQVTSPDVIVDPELTGIDSEADVVDSAPAPEPAAADAKATIGKAMDVESPANATENDSSTESVLASHDESPEEVMPEPVAASTKSALAPDADEPESDPIDTGSQPSSVVEVEVAPKQGFFARIKAGLSRTRSNLTDGLANLLLGKKAIDDDLLEELETQLIMADVGVEATADIMARLTERVSRKELKDSDALYDALIDELKGALSPVEAPLTVTTSKAPFVILMVGINGVGKTTTIGKLARQFQSEGKSVMLAAGDTFRAAAVEQLQVWGERNQVPVIAQHTGADSASVIFDALQAAQSRKVDVLIADTAGRLHNKDNLMQELEKVVRVMKKLDPAAPHEVMLVLDAGTGQNAINQTRQFLQTVGVTGLTLTKLDGTAKGGVIFALAKQFGIPVRFIGVGEGIEDLRPFHAGQFIDALFQRDSSGD